LRYRATLSSNPSTVKNKQKSPPNNNNNNNKRTNKRIKQTNPNRTKTKNKMKTKQKKKKKKNWVLVVTPAILITQETIIRRIVVQSQPQANSLQAPS
jgi:hypothetical protein